MGVKDMDDQLLAAILALFDSPSLREVYQTRVELAGEGGRALLRILHAELANMPIGVSNLTLGKIDLMFQQGIPDFTRTNVATFHLALDELNSQLPPHLRVSDGSLVAKYAAMSVHYDAEIIQKMELAEVRVAPKDQNTLPSARSVLNSVLLKLEMEENTRRAHAAITGAGGAFAGFGDKARAKAAHANASRGATSPSTTRARARRALSNATGWRPTALANTATRATGTRTARTSHPARLGASPTPPPRSPTPPPPAPRTSQPARAGAGHPAKEKKRGKNPNPLLASHT